MPQNEAADRLFGSGVNAERYAEIFQAVGLKRNDSDCIMDHYVNKRGFVFYSKRFLSL